VIVLDLKKRLDEMKQYSSMQNVSKLNKRIYGLELDETFLKSLSHKELCYVHVKLHNALYYKKPFAKFEDIKRVHDLVINLLDNHVFVDELDK